MDDTYVHCERQNKKIIIIIQKSQYMIFLTDYLYDTAANKYLNTCQSARILTLWIHLFEVISCIKTPVSTPYNQ